MDYIKKVINEIQCLIADTIMTEGEGSRRCITTEDLNGFEKWCQWLEKASEGNHPQQSESNFAIPVVCVSVCNCKIKEPVTFTEHGKIVVKCINCGKPIANEL